MEDAARAEPAVLMGQVLPDVVAVLRDGMARLEQIAGTLFTARERRRRSAWLRIKLRQARFTRECNHM